MKSDRPSELIDVLDGEVSRSEIAAASNTGGTLASMVRTNSVLESDGAGPDDRSCGYI